MAETHVKVLVDSSAWVEALRPDGKPEVRAEVGRLLRDGRAVLCDLVLLELWNGARGNPEREVVRTLETDLEVLPTTPAVFAASRNLARDCRSAGLTVPATDLLVAATAAVHGVAVYDRDSHFDKLARLSAGG